MEGVPVPHVKSVILDHGHQRERMSGRMGERTRCVPHVMAEILEQSMDIPQERISGRIEESMVLTCACRTSW